MDLNFNFKIRNARIYIMCEKLHDFLIRADFQFLELKWKSICMGRLRYRLLPENCFLLYESIFFSQTSFVLD